MATDVAHNAIIKIRRVLLKPEAVKLLEPAGDGVLILKGQIHQYMIIAVARFEGR